jgi:hypothetical protein
VADDTKILDVQLKLDKQGFVVGLQQAGREVEGFSKSGAGMGSSMTGHMGGVGTAALGMGAAVGAAAIAGGAALIGITMSAANFAREIGLASQTTGLSVTEIERMKFAADKSGISLEQFEKGTVKLAKSMEAAKNGTGPAAKEFADLGIQVTNTDGSLKGTNEVLLQVADKMQACQNPTERMVMATTLFGKAGADMIPMLAKGSEGISALGDEADKFGLVLDAQGIQKLRDFKMSLSVSVNQESFSRYSKTLGKQSKTFCPRSSTCLPRSWVSLQTQVYFPGSAASSVISWGPS